MAIYNTLLDEAKRVKGYEYPDVYGADKNTLGTSSQNKMGTTSLGKGGLIDSIAQNNIEDYDLEKEKIIKESSNIVGEYMIYIGEKGGSLYTHMEKLMRTNGKEGNRMVSNMAMYMKQLLELGYSENDVQALCFQDFFGFEDLKKHVSNLDVNMNSENPEDYRKLNSIYEKTLKNVLQLRINYVNRVTSLMAKMLQTNYKVLGLSEKQAQIYIEALTSGDNRSTKAAGEIKNLIKQNRDKFIVNGGDAIDLTSLGFGVILGPFKELKLFDDIGDNDEVLLRMIQQAIRYDVVVVAHGNEGETDDQESDGDVKNDDPIVDYSSKWGKIDGGSLGIGGKFYEEEDKIIDTVDDKYYKQFTRLAHRVSNKASRLVSEYVEIIKKETKHTEIDKYIKNCSDKLKNITPFDEDIVDYIDGLEDDKEQLNKITNSYSKYRKLIYDAFYDLFILRLAKINKLKKDEDYVKNNSAKNVGDTHEGWTCIPTRTLKSKYFTDVNSLVRQLIKEGYKKILIEDCNPGGHKLAKDIMETKGVLINYSDFSNYLESSIIDSNSEDYVYLQEAENSLKELAESFDIDYNDDEYLVECCNWYLDGIENGFESLNEGVIDSLKEFCKKIIGGIIGLIKRIINFVKTAIQKFIGLFRGTKENPKDTKTEFPKEIKTPLIDIEKKKVIEVSSKNREDFEKEASRICSALSKAIKEINQNQQNSLKNFDKAIDEVGKLKEKVEKQSSTTGTEKKESFYFSGFTAGIFENSILHEFDANGEEEDVEDEDYTVDDNEEDNQDNDQENTENNGETTDNTEDQPETQDDEGDEEYTLDEPENAGDDIAPQDDAGVDDTPDNTDEPNETGDEDNNEDEYTLDDPGEEGGEDAGTDDQQDGDATGGETPADGEEGDEEYSLDDGSSNNGEEGPDDDMQDKLDSIKQIEKDLFENLTPEQKEIKIKTLKKNFMTLHGKCTSILDMINDSTPSEESVVQVFDYIQKTVQELQDNMHDYLTYTFDTKGYLDNQAQFKQYLTILNSVKNILNEFISEPDSNKQS